MCSTTCSPRHQAGACRSGIGQTCRPATGPWADLTLGAATYVQPHPQQRQFQQFADIGFCRPPPAPAVAACCRACLNSHSLQLILNIGLVLVYQHSQAWPGWRRRFPWRYTTPARCRCCHQSVVLKWFKQPLALRFGDARGRRRRHLLLRPAGHAGRNGNVVRLLAAIAPALRHRFHSTVQMAAVEM